MDSIQIEEEYVSEDGKIIFGKIPKSDHLKFIAAQKYSSTLKWLDKGFKLIKVDDLTQKVRISTCEKCEHFNEEYRACSLCFCPMDFKTSLMYDPISLGGKKVKIECSLDKNKKW